MNASAAETILWEGDWNVSWDLSDGDEHREWKGLGQEDFAAMEVGQKLYFYLTVTNDSYHKYNFDNWGWQALPGHEAEHAADFGFNADSKIEFIVTQDIKDAIATGGFAMHGHGYHVAKVTKEVSFSDLAPRVLWTGEKALSGFVPESGLHLNFNENGITTACNLYLLVDHAGDLRITRNSNGWEDWPSAGFNHCTGNIDANNIIKVELPQDFVDAVTEGEGDGYWHEIVLWGDGLTIKGIATTKETLLNSVTTDAKGYATYSSNNTLALNNLPDGLEAYTAWLDGTTLRFNQKTAAVGSGTGLLIKGGANTTYYIPAKTDATEPDYNALSANLSSTLRKSDDTHYIFVMKKATSGSGSPEFQKLSTEGVTVPAKKAYVQIAKSAFGGGGAHELGISFGNEDVTAINAVKVVAKADNRYYNLSGQVVANPTKGIYILNGKKVVIK